MKKHEETHVPQGHTQKFAGYLVSRQAEEDFADESTKRPSRRGSELLDSGLHEGQGAWHVEGLAVE